MLGTENLYTELEPLNPGATPLRQPPGYIMLHRSFRLQHGQILDCVGLHKDLGTLVRMLHPASTKLTLQGVGIATAPGTTINED